MGFLSRKSKFVSTPVEDEPHPIVEELERMEEAVPEGLVDEKTSEGSTAGPVPDDGGALRAGHGPSSTHP
jgi:hypothetical protein